MRASVYVWHVKVYMCVCVFLDYFNSFVCVQVIFSFCDRTTCDATSESSYEIMPSMFCLQQVTSSPCSSHSSMVTFELPIGSGDVGQANGHPFALFQRLRLVRAWGPYTDCIAEKCAAGFSIENCWQAGELSWTLKMAWFRGRLFDRYHFRLF